MWRNMRRNDPSIGATPLPVPTQVLAGFPAALSGQILTKVRGVSVNKV